MFGYADARAQGCGGALVSDRYVITAAHCTDGHTVDDLKVLIGDTTFAAGFIMNVTAIKQHPEYCTSGVNNDISVLELEYALDLTRYPNIKPICLPTQDSTYVGTSATVSGWGTVASGGNANSHLHEVAIFYFNIRLIWILKVAGALTHVYSWSSIFLEGKFITYSSQLPN